MRVASGLARRLRRVITAITLGLLAAVPEASGPRPAIAAELQTLEIASKSGVHVFAVEIATSDAEREKGLMFRRELA